MLVLVSEAPADTKFEKPHKKLTGGLLHGCGFSSFMSISHSKCPLDVQLDMKVRISAVSGGATPCGTRSVALCSRFGG
jgi:hypothetical protein